jgi:hypothetical protein
VLDRRGSWLADVRQHSPSDTTSPVGDLELGCPVVAVRLSSASPAVAFEQRNVFAWDEQSVFGKLDAVVLLRRQ